MFLRDFAVSVAVGMILLLLLSRLIDRVQFSLSTAFWCSLIGHSFLSVVSLFMGFLFARQRSDFSLPWPLDASSRRSCSKSPFAQRMALLCAGGRSFLLWLWILGDFFVASPPIELWERFRSWRGKLSDPS